MLRISPYDKGERIEQAGAFRVEPGGSESNVAIALARLGHHASFVTRIPDNPLKNLILRYLRQYNVDTSYIELGGNRIGIYWTEDGVSVRPTNLIYDRENSSFYEAGMSDFNLKSITANAAWFHVSGITPAVSEKSCRNILAITKMLSKTTRISVDINYRKKLWQWIKADKNKKVKQAMEALCSRVYLMTANESDLQDVFGFAAAENEIPPYEKTAESVFKKFPHLRYIGISLRTSHSASENDWSGLLFTKEGRRFAGPKYKLTNIVDRVGTGDSFTAGIIHGIIRFEKQPQKIIDFAMALSALNHTVRGDASQFDANDVEQVLRDRGLGRIIR